MYASSANKSGGKKKKELIFDDAEAYTIPNGESWNEGYSHSNKFLYCKDGAGARINRNNDAKVLSASK